MNTFLRRLELHGFKSFAGKTVMEFPSRIVAIVGPNGSGKSNVIDALRWVLGEREAKQLRGLTLENLIFAGTPKKPQMSFAKVALSFDNRDGLFPSEAKEVSLARRVDRSGTSAFLLNDEEIRLKDLLPLLARAKLGTRGLTMIGQGQSTLFVEASPDERRTMIEEVLGLKEYRLKKHEAERRMSQSEVNMEKVKAQIQELTPHLSFLRRQKKKWEKRSELASDLFDLENRYYGAKFRFLTDARGSLLEPVKDLKEREGIARREIHKLEGNIEKLKEKAGEAGEAKRLREEISGRFARRSELERSLARIEAEMEFRAPAAPLGGDAEAAAEALKFSERELSRALHAEDANEVKGIIRTVLDRIGRALKGTPAEADKALSVERERVAGLLKESDAEIKKLEAEHEKLFALQEKANEEFRSEIEALEARKNDVRKMEHDIQAQQFEYEKVGLKLEEVEREWVAFGRAKEELATLPVPEEPAEGPEAERKMFRLRGLLAEVGEIDEALVREAQESEERHAFLERELDDVESAIKDLKKLVADLEGRIHDDFESAFKKINEEFQTHFSLMFGGGRAKLKLERPAPPPPPVEGDPPDGGASKAPEEEDEKPEDRGVEIEVNIPRKKITNLDMLSGGEKSLVSLAALFALISVSPPPFLVLDEIDVALDDANAKRFADLVTSFSQKTQFIIVTHNRVTMEVAEALYGVTMADDGVSKLLSIRFEEGVGLTRKAK